MLCCTLLAGSTFHVDIEQSVRVRPAGPARVIRKGHVNGRARPATRQVFWRRTDIVIQSVAQDDQLCTRPAGVHSRALASSFVHGRHAARFGRAMAGDGPSGCALPSQWRAEHRNDIACAPLPQQSASRKIPTRVLRNQPPIQIPDLNIPSEIAARRDHTPQHVLNLSAGTSPTSPPGSGTTLP